MEHLLKEAEENPIVPEGDSLALISTYAKKLIQFNKEAAELEERFMEKRKECIKLSQELIPESMKAVNMTSFALDTGQLVKVEEALSVTIKDAESFYDFLEERGDGSLMKITLEIGKVPKTILAKITKVINEEFGILAESKLFIHPMTLKSYITKLCGIGGKTEAEMSLIELDENMIGTFTYYKTTVK